MDAKNAKLLVFAVAFLLLLLQNVFLLRQKKLAEQEVEALKARIEQMGARPDGDAAR
jgi:hypothetical protein